MSFAFSYTNYPHMFCYEWDHQNLFFNLFFYCCSSTVVSIFPLPCHPTLHIFPSHPRTYPFGFVQVAFIYVLWWPFPYFSYYPSLPSPLVTVSLFFLSMSLVMFCLLACFDYTLRILKHQSKRTYVPQCS